MVIARRIISIIEGFKLGSLGVKKPVAAGVALAAYKAPLRKKIWKFKDSSTDTVWFEYLKPEWEQLLQVPNTPISKIVYVRLRAVGLNSFTPYLEITPYEGTEDDIGKILFQHDFVIPGVVYPDVRAVNKWRKGQHAGIQGNGLESLGFPQKWVSGKAPLVPTSIGDKTNMSPWNKSSGTGVLRWTEYAKPAWDKVLNLDKVKGDKIVTVTLVGIIHGVANTALKLVVQAYTGDHTKVGKFISERKFEKPGLASLVEAHKWIKDNKGKIEQGGLSVIGFPAFWTDVTNTPMSGFAGPASSPTKPVATGTIQSVRNSSGASLIVHDQHSTDKAFLHSKKRVDIDLTVKQLLTRLGKIKVEQKLLDTAIALELSSDPAKQALAPMYLERLERGFGYVVKRS
jgi:hypothetical protein